MKAPQPKVSASAQKHVSLALQGGGSHGAFTWGVLDHLLEDGRLHVEAISGCSAGAMNAVVFAEGYLDGGADGARQQLHDFWYRVSDDQSVLGTMRSLFDTFFRIGSYENSPFYTWVDFFTHYASPYDFNPLDINPLRDYLKQMIDFDKLRATDGLKLFISATNVETGKIKIFQRSQLHVEHILASACLPYLFKAVEIDGMPYWDGGYMGNPALFPLFYKASSRDVVLVQINPVSRQGTPRTARDIQSRLNEITFNGALLSEFRAIDFVNRLAADGALDGERYKQVYVHRIEGGKHLAQYSSASKLDSSWSFLQKLRDLGRACAKSFLEQHYDDINHRGTLNLRQAFTTLDDPPKS